MSKSELYKYDIVHRSADEGFDGTYHTNVVVKHNGSCLYVPPGIFKSTCKIDITWFPFDDQHCEMKFGSWTYDGNQVPICDCRTKVCTKTNSFNKRTKLKPRCLHLFARLDMFAQHYTICNHLESIWLETLVALMLLGNEIWLSEHCIMVAIPWTKSRFQYSFYYFVFVTLNYTNKIVQ